MILQYTKKYNDKNKMLLSVIKTNEKREKFYLYFCNKCESICYG